jgi:hypothetical protein
VLSVESQQTFLRRQVLPKRWSTFNRLHGVTSKEVQLFIATAVRTSNPTGGLTVTCMRDKKIKYILFLPSVEAGSNTSTVALRVAEGDENGSLESETVKYGHESHGT